MIYDYKTPDKDNQKTSEDETFTDEIINSFEKYDLFFVFGLLLSLHLFLIYHYGGIIIVSIIILIWVVFAQVTNFVKSTKDSAFYISYDSIYQSNIKPDNTIDSMKIFKIFYLIMSIVLLTTENKTINILLLIGFGLLFQLINSAILYILIVDKYKNIIPSVFVYLDEYIKNTDEVKDDFIYHIIGSLRLFLVVLLSIGLGYKITKNKTKTIKLLTIFTIFTFIVALWILIIGDESINNRTFLHYRGKGHEYGGNIIKYLMPQVIQAQGGVIANISLILLSVAL